MSDSQHSASSPVRGPVVDWQAARDSMGGDEDLLRSVVDVLLDEAPRQLDAMRAAAAAGDAKSLRRAAHTLKGSLRYFGAVAAALQAESIEELGQAGEVRVPDEAFARLDIELAAVLDELRAFRRRSAG